MMRQKVFHAVTVAACYMLHLASVHFAWIVPDQRVIHLRQQHEGHVGAI